MTSITSPSATLSKSNSPPGLERPGWPTDREGKACTGHLPTVEICTAASLSAATQDARIDSIGVSTETEDLLP